MEVEVGLLGGWLRVGFEDMVVERGSWVWGIVMCIGRESDTCRYTAHVCIVHVVSVLRYAPVVTWRYNDLFLTISRYWQADQKGKSGGKGRSG